MAISQINFIVNNIKGALKSAETGMIVYYLKLKIITIDGGILVWMFNTKDVSMIIVMAVLCVVTTALVGQVATMITGIPGANYVIVIFFAIQTSFAFLLYEGRRWRFFTQMTLVTFLIIPTYLGGIPFDLLSKMNFIVNSFQCDLLFNSFYGTFKKQNKLV